MVYTEGGNLLLYRSYEKIDLDGLIKFNGSFVF